SQRTLIYTNTNWWNPCTGNNGSFGDQLLDIANYSGSAGTLPAGWSNWNIWQYSDRGDLPGDQNVFNGDLAALGRLAGADPGPRVLWEGAQAVTHGGFTSVFTVDAGTSHLQESFLS